MHAHGAHNYKNIWYSTAVAVPFYYKYTHGIYTLKYNDDGYTYIYIKYIK